MDTGLPVVPVSATSNAPNRKSRLRHRAVGVGVQLDPITGSGGGGTLPPGAPSYDASFVDRRKLCEEMLADGFVQSFVDFFYLTHRPEPNQEMVAQAVAADPEGLSGPLEIDVPPREMLFVREQLAAAENARRQGDTGTVYASYSALAKHYHAAEDPKTGVYFYEKCLEISRLTNDSRGEMAANHDLGLINQSMKQPGTAAKYHERHLSLAEKEDNEPEKRTAARELVKCYRSIAESHEAADENNAAVQFYVKCLESAQLAKDRQSEGLANYRLGRAFVMLGDANRAIPYLEDYESICQELEDREGEGQACAALASAYQALQNDERALSYLKTCLEVATETENLVAQGEACCALGVIYNKTEEFEQAVEHFERNFELCRTTCASNATDTSLVDVARVYVGMARGNFKLKKYVHLINTDPVKLLQWKIKRIFPSEKKKKKKARDPSGSKPAQRGAGAAAAAES